MITRGGNPPEPLPLCVINHTAGTKLILPHSGTYAALKPLPLLRVQRWPHSRCFLKSEMGEMIVTRFPAQRSRHPDVDASHPA